MLLWIDGNSRFGGCMPRSIEARGILDLRNCGSPADESDRAVLVSLYHTTGGGNWRDSQNWLGNAVMGEWSGVATDPDGRVTGLRLGGNRPAGALPVELGRLPNLRELVLTDNRLRGSIPSELGNLGKFAAIAACWQSQTDRLHSIPAACGGIRRSRLRFCSADRPALVMLYEATGGPNCKNRENWLSEQPVSEWHGVTADAQGRVAKLRLS